MRLTTSGNARNVSGAVVGRITTQNLPHAERSEYIRFLPQGEGVAGDFAGYRAVLSHDDVTTDVPVVDRLRESDHFTHGDVVVMEGGTGFVRSLYRPYERHHSLFVTERCSSNCLMCSQPPKDKDDVEALTKRNQELIRLMSPAPAYLTITGGEPTELQSLEVVMYPYSRRRRCALLTPGLLSRRQFFPTRLSRRPRQFRRKNQDARLHRYG